MSRLEYFVVAESMSTDQATNRVSVFNILESIGFSDFPAQVQSLVSIACFVVDPEDVGADFQATVKVRAPDGATPYEFPVNFTISPDVTRQRITHRLSGFPFTAPGDWTFELLLNGDHAADHLVTVQQIESVEQ